MISRYTVVRNVSNKYAVYYVQTNSKMFWLVYGEPFQQPQQISGYGKRVSFNITILEYYIPYMVSGFGIFKLGAMSGKYK